MIERASLLKAAAGQIDAHDAEIRAANDAKKDVYADVRESVAPEDFRAWRDAVKLRQKRGTPDQREALERHDARVWAVLAMLEAPEQPGEAETPPAATVAPASGIVEETVPTRARARAAREAVPHDPDTGELIEPPAASSPGPVPAQAAPDERASHSWDGPPREDGQSGAADNCDAEPEPSGAEQAAGGDSDSRLPAADLITVTHEFPPYTDNPDLPPFLDRKKIRQAA